MSGLLNQRRPLAERVWSEKQPGQACASAPGRSSSGRGDQWRSRGHVDLVGGKDQYGHRSVAGARSEDPCVGLDSGARDDKRDKRETRTGHDGGRCPSKALRLPRQPDRVSQRRHRRRHWPAMRSDSCSGDRVSGAGAVWGTTMVAHTAPRSRCQLSRCGRSRTRAARTVRRHWRPTYFACWRDP
jgi:hypothetical protein